MALIYNRDVPTDLCLNGAEEVLRVIADACAESHMGQLSG